MRMIKCPQCGKEISGRARVCGHCNAPLMKDYFSQPSVGDLSGPMPVRGGIIAMVVGVIGALVLLAGVVYQLWIYTQEQPPFIEPVVFWQVRVCLFGACASSFLALTLFRHGARASLVWDYAFVFLFSFGMCFTLWGYLELGATAFFTSDVIPALLINGCALCLVSCILTILGFSRNRQSVTVATL